MLTHDQLQTIPDNVRIGYLRAMVEDLILSAPPYSQLKLRALQAKCDGIRARVKNPTVCARIMADVMLNSLTELNDVLNE
jgi:hypothetical protein